MNKDRFDKKKKEAMKKQENIEKNKPKEINLEENEE